VEYQVDIGGTMYGMKDIQSCTIERPLFDKLSVGNACSAELDISLWPTSTIPRMATIKPYARKESSEAWTQLGVFYTDTREVSNGLMSIVAYDAMLKGEATWLTSDYDTDDWPKSQDDSVQDIAGRLGVEVDSRTVLSDKYPVDYPIDEDGEKTMRQVLCEIAAANGGNWVITNEGKLLLVPLFDSMPEETNYLVSEGGDAITFGGVRILV
jgi:hypothetical protein